MKYHQDRNQITPLAQAAAEFMRTRTILPNLTVIIPVPPSDGNRLIQPVIEVAEELGRRIGLEVPIDYVYKTRAVSPLKNLDDQASRHQELVGAYTVQDDRYRGKSVLVFDDIYRSGETLNAVTDVVMKQGGVAKVYVLVLTRTRVKR